MKNRIKASKPAKSDADKFAKCIDELSKQLHELELSDLEYLDEIPDDEIIDEPIPFPYGGYGEFGKWNTEPK